MSTNHAPSVVINQNFGAALSALVPAVGSPDQPNILADLQSSKFPPEFRTDVPISPEERMALKKFRKLVPELACGRDLIFLLSRCAMAHPEMIWKQFVADAQYADNEGLRLLDYLNSLMAAKPSRPRK